MAQALFLILPSFLGALAFALAGFGPALVFLFFWFSFDQLGCLDISNELKDAVFMASMTSFTSATVYSIQNYPRIQRKLSSYMAFFGIIGVISGYIDFPSILKPPCLRH